MNFFKGLFFHGVVFVGDARLRSVDQYIHATANWNGVRKPVLTSGIKRWYVWRFCAVNIFFELNEMAIVIAVVFNYFIASGCNPC